MTTQMDRIEKTLNEILKEQRLANMSYSEAEYRFRKACDEALMSVTKWYCEYIDSMDDKTLKELGWKNLKIPRGMKRKMRTIGREDIIERVMATKKRWFSWKTVQNSKS